MTKAPLARGCLLFRPLAVALSSGGRDNTAGTELGDDSSGGQQRDRRRPAPGADGLIEEPGPALQPPARCDYGRRSEQPRLSALYGRCHELGQTAATNMLHIFLPLERALVAG